MTIRINHIAVDFSLDRETTAKDLTSALRAWATGQNLAVLSILYDGRALGPEDETPLASVDLVDVEAVPVGERELARVAVVGRFFSLLASAAAEKNSSLMLELNREYLLVRSALETLLSPVLSRLSSAIAVLDAPWEVTEEVHGAAQSIALEAEALRSELQDPCAAFRETLAGLNRLLDATSTLSALFQNGQDREGFAIILSLFTHLEDLSRRAPLALHEANGDNLAWAAHSSELTPLLNEAETALTSKDYIFLTDLVEYELVPRLRTVQDRVPDILKLDPATSVH